MCEKITVSMVGCCLVDRVYNNLCFSSPVFSPYLSKRKGDGGLTPGHLVFKEEFETFCQQKLSEVLKKITNGEASETLNIGGPGVVPLIHVAQMLEENGCSVRFYGSCGNDEDGRYLREALKQTPVKINNYRTVNGATPSTIVLSDPGFNKGNGERIFINSIGAAWDYSPDNMDDDFFSSDIVVFGGTALVPQIHDSLTSLLQKAKTKGCITIVNTVYDFRNEKENPDKKWPLGESDDSYKYIDLLMTDFEEALRLSGKSSVTGAIQFFREMGTGAVIVTNGSDNLVGFSEGSLFVRQSYFEMPVSEAVPIEIQNGVEGDTTGCGDNFAGGVIAGLVLQVQKKNVALDLIEACAWGVVSGGYSCFYVGGTFFEKFQGEKKKLISTYYQKYKRQLGDGV